MSNTITEEVTLPPAPPVYTELAGGVLGEPPPYSQQGPALPERSARPQSQPPPPQQPFPQQPQLVVQAALPPQPSPPTPMISGHARSQSVTPIVHSSTLNPGQHPPVPTPAPRASGSSAPSSPSRTLRNMFKSMSRLDMSSRRDSPSSPVDKPLPPVPRPEPSNASPISHRPTGPAMAYGPDHSAPPVPPRPSGPPAFSPPRNALPVVQWAAQQHPRPPPVRPASARPISQPPPRPISTGWTPVQTPPRAVTAAPVHVSASSPPPPRPCPNCNTTRNYNPVRPIVAAGPLPVALITPPPRHPVAAASAAGFTVVKDPPPSTPTRRSSTPPPPKASPQGKTKTKQGRKSIPISASLFAAAAPKDDVIDLTADDSDATFVPSDDSVLGTLRTPTRGTKATSAPPSASGRSADGSSTVGRGKSRASSVVSSPASTQARCAGFTRSGQPCKRTVKAAAPFFAYDAPGDSDDTDAPASRAVGRYCRDHAHMVCAADGFYWRDARGKAGAYIKFDDYIPKDLGQQTQTLLRMTMESPLAQKDLPGFLYIYELRTLSSSPSTSYYKVGRSDNVPRRIGQWSAQCASHTPTLRDIFPLKPPPGSVARAPSILGSLLPGAVRGGTDAARMVPAVKRWERLVHLELADRAAKSRGKEYAALNKKCADCGSVHREIFPLAGRKGKEYEALVEIVGRWEKFVRAISV